MPVSKAHSKEIAVRQAQHLWLEGGNDFLGQRNLTAPQRHRLGCEQNVRSILKQRNES